MLSFTAESFAASGASKLRWGRPAVVKATQAKTMAGQGTKAVKVAVGKVATIKATIQPSVSSQRNQTLIAKGQAAIVPLLATANLVAANRDAAVTNAVWDDQGDGSQIRLAAVHSPIALGSSEQSPSLQSPVTLDHSIVVGRPGPSYDPFEEDDRLALLPDDPFDEPSEDAIEMPEPDQSPFDQEPMEEGPNENNPVKNGFGDLGTAQEAIDAELERRRVEDDLLEEGPNEQELVDQSIEDSLQPETIEVVEPTTEDPAEEMAAPGETTALELGGADRYGEQPVDQFENPNDNSSDNEETREGSSQGLFLPTEAEQGGEEGFFPGDEPLTPEELEERQRELEVERLESVESCRAEFAEMKADLISSIDLSIRVEGTPGEDYPFTCAAGNTQLKSRQWPAITYNWKAAALCHKPLYFEQVQLERYGHTWGPFVQPIMSGVHFFGTLPILPYKMGIRTPNECVYALGYYRPGSCAPFMIDPIPFTWRAALFQGGAVTGLSYIIP